MAKIEALFGEARLGGGHDDFFIGGARGSVPAHGDDVSMRILRPMFVLGSWFV